MKIVSTIAPIFLLLHARVLIYTYTGRSEYLLLLFIVVGFLIVMVITKNTHACWSFGGCLILGKILKCSFDETCNGDFTYCFMDTPHVELNPFDITFVLAMYLKTLMFFFYFVPTENNEIWSDIELHPLIQTASSRESFSRSSSRTSSISRSDTIDSNW